MILWCIWLCVFLIRAVSLLYSAHRQLYLLKQDLKLCNRAEESFTAAVDTHTATQTGKAKLPLYWHLLPLVMVFIPLFFSSVRNYIHADTTGLLFLVTWIAVWLLFLLIAWCYSKTGNRIYSAHTEINLAINMQEHRSWSWMFFFYSLCNSLAFISELIFLANDLEWYWWSHLLFFIFQTIPIVTIFVIYFRVKKKKAQIARKNPFSRIVLTFVEKFCDKDKWILWFKIIVACIPTIVIALPFNDFIEEKFNNYVVVAIALIVYGVIFIIVENYNKRRKPICTSLEDLSFATAFKIGIFQVLSVIPGTSRSGSTIIGGILVGTSRTVAAEFYLFSGNSGYVRSESAETGKIRLHIHSGRGSYTGHRRCGCIFCFYYRHQIPDGIY